MLSVSIKHPDAGDFKEEIISEETRDGVYRRDSYISAYVNDQEIRVFCKYAVKAGAKNAPGLLNVHGWMGLPAIDESYVQDGWAAGYVIGTVSGSDDHVAQPGKRGGGLTAVMAESLTRESILDAIRERRTYATTGDRIILDFWINGKPMGSVIEPSSEVNIRARVIGTAPIRKIEILRYDWGGGAWSVPIMENPGRDVVNLDKTLTTPVPAIYYMRVEQEGLVAGRPVRAWSSPIWVGRPQSNIKQHRRKNR